MHASRPAVESSNRPLSVGPTGMLRDATQHSGASDGGIPGCITSSDRKLTMPSVEEPMSRSVRGDDEFRELLNRRQGELTRLAFTICGDWMLAEDCVAEAIARTWVRSRSHEIQKLDAYVTRAVVNASIGSVRRRWRRMPRSSVVADEVPGPEEESARNDWARRAVLVLGPKHRAVVALFYLEDRSELDVALILGIPVGTVKSRLTRALDLLRKEIAHDGII